MNGSSEARIAVIRECADSWADEGEASVDMASAAASSSVTAMANIRLHRDVHYDCKGVQRLKSLLEAPCTVSLPGLVIASKKLTSNITAPALAFVCNHVKCPLPPKTKKSTKGLPYTKAEYTDSLFCWVSTDFHYKT